ncbi:MAG: hypothetical protein ACHQQQ_07320 [Bacteroidota bacterium]
MNEPILIVVIIVVLFVPIIGFRFRYIKRAIEAVESIAESLKKIAENQGKH